MNIGFEGTSIRADLIGWLGEVRCKSCELSYMCDIDIDFSVRESINNTGFSESCSMIFSLRKIVTVF